MFHISFINQHYEKQPAIMDIKVIYILLLKEKEIPEYLFNENTNLKQISIPSSVTSIGSGAFHGCSLLAQISIPSSVTSIGDYAFYKYSSLTQIYMQSSLK